MLSHSCIQFDYPQCIGYFLQDFYMMCAEELLINKVIALGSLYSMSLVNCAFIA